MTTQNKSLKTAQKKQFDDGSEKELGRKWMALRKVLRKMLLTRNLMKHSGKRVRLKNESENQNSKMTVLKVFDEEGSEKELDEESDEKEEEEDAYGALD